MSWNVSFRSILLLFLCLFESSSYAETMFFCESVKLVYQRPAPDPVGDNSGMGV